MIQIAAMSAGAGSSDPRRQTTRDTTGSRAGLLREAEDDLHVPLIVLQRGASCQCKQ